MSLPRSPYRPYLGVVHRPVLAALQRFGMSRLAHKWIRVSNRDYAWPLAGMLAGSVMRLAAREDFQYLAPNYEPQVCGAIQRLVKPGFVCADVGAHLGYMTMLMAKLAGVQGHIFSFEAAPENARLLQHNVHLNGCQQRITVVNRAVTDRSQAALTLYRGPSSFEASVVENPHGESFTVAATTLDDYFRDQPCLDFVKMDIEGAEAQAVVGMQRILGHLRPMLLLEVHDAGWPALDHLQAANYVLHDLQLRRIDVARMRLQRINHCVAAPADRMPGTNE